MGRRERGRQREAQQETPAEETQPEDAPRESGLLKGQTDPAMRQKLQRIGEGLRGQYGTPGRHADHDPSVPCRPALGNGLCEVVTPR